MRSRAAHHAVPAAPDTLPDGDDAVLRDIDALLTDLDAVLTDNDAVLTNHDAVLTVLDAVLSAFDAVLSAFDAVLSAFDAVLLTKHLDFIGRHTVPAADGPPPARCLPGPSGERGHPRSTPPPICNLTRSIEGIRLPFAPFDQREEEVTFRQTSAQHPVGIYHREAFGHDAEEAAE